MIWLIHWLYLPIIALTGRGYWSPIEAYIFKNDWKTDDTTADQLLKLEKYVWRRSINTLSGDGKYFKRTFIQITKQKITTEMSDLLAK